MELVYLWVEKYKNIEKQGFNFSPRFECKYDEGTNELTIDEKIDYVNIFPENINITAIVGENGSGKSSLLTGITNHKIVIEIGGKLYSNDFPNVNNNIQLKELDRVKDYEIIYLDYDLIKINPIKDFWDYSMFNIYDKNLYTQVVNDTFGNHSFNIGKFRERFFNILIEHFEVFQSDLFFFNPTSIIITDHLHTINTENFEYINKLIKEVQGNYCSKEKLLIYLYSDVSMKPSLGIEKIETIQNILEKEKDILRKADYFEIDNIQEIYDFFDSLNDFQDKNNISIKEFSAIYTQHSKAFLYLIEIGYLQTDFNDSLSREYFGLSQGERKFFTESLMIFDAIMKSEKDEILLVLDEPDLTLHPEWQKRYMSELIKLISNFSNKKFHIIITSHSPFILSDLPKNNVIFLKNGKQVDVDINPFGANIHTLLSHGFFMQDGLMGEFAKGKIEEIKKFYELIKKLEKRIQKHSKTKKFVFNSFQRRKNRFENIHKIIGEPFLKTIIGNYLDELHLILSDNETLIDKELHELEERRKYLEDLKSD